MNEVDEAGLLDRARQGDEPAFAELFERYQRPIYRYAVHMCGAEAGDDVVQETFMAVLQQRGRADQPQGPVLGYLMGIARHRVWKRLATTGKDVTAHADDTIDIEERERVAEAESALDALTRAEAIAAVRTAVQSLPVVYREVVVLCELEEMNYAAAADVIACPVGTVRSRLHRAKALLARKLQSKAVTEPAGTR